MGWLSERLSSSIGKKIIMALTGLLLILFLIIHLLNNLLLYVGPEMFNENVARLEAIKPLVRVIEIALALLFALHIFNALKLWYENKKANPNKYAVDASSENSTVFSRSMVITGVTIGIFLIIHLATFWRTFNFGAHPTDGRHPFYAIIQDAFANPFIALFYFIVMIVLGFHLKHAFQSAFQTMGWRHPKYTPIVEKIGTAIAIIMAVGFASIPIFFYISSLGGK